MQEPQVDGPPQLLPIEGTPLSYVANSGTPIVEVDAHSWYACQNGVWFVATSVGGPWTVAASVPEVIYSIPASSPLHYLTYVQVYGANPAEVYEGYTPGYLGTEVEDGVVVYGTGYWYPPWIGGVWYGWPCTWGLGWNPCWTPWDDWGFAFGFGWGCGFGRFAWDRCHPPRPCWGSFRTGPRPGGLLAEPRWDDPPADTAARLYQPREANRAVLDHPITSGGLARHYGRAYNSRTGALAGGQQGGVRNIYSLRSTPPGSAGFQGISLSGPHNERTFGQTASKSGSLGFGRGSSSWEFGSARPYGVRSGGISAGSQNRGGFWGRVGGVFHGDGGSRGGGGFSHSGGGGGHGAGGGGGGHGGGGGGSGGGHK